jgi:hypothetical protein
MQRRSRARALFYFLVMNISQFNFYWSKNLGSEVSDMCTV